MKQKQPDKRPRSKGIMVVVVLLVGLLSLAALALTRDAPTPRPIVSDSSTAGQVTRVDPTYVCMVNNRSYPKPQIPVPVGDRMYYGCCEMCKETLATSLKHRTSVDPISGNLVDKAAAVIGALPGGTVRYFESEANLLAFDSRMSR